MCEQSFPPEKVVAWDNEEEEGTENRVYRYVDIRTLTSKKR
jgi:hypothetical protein